MQIIAPVAPSPERKLWQYGCKVCKVRPTPVTDWSPLCHGCGTHWTQAYAK